MENKITKKDFDKIVKYCKKNHIDSALSFLETNEKEITIRYKKLKDLMSPELLDKALCGDFVVAAFALQHGGGYPNSFPWPQNEFSEAASLFDMKKIISSDIEVPEELNLSETKLHYLVRKNLDYQYIKSVIDKIAEANNYKILTNQQFKETKFSIKELNEWMVGLKEDGDCIYYKLQFVNTYDEYSQYYIKNKKNKK